MNEDFNEFNRLDCAGAATMLACVPAVFYFVDSDHDFSGTILMVAFALGVGAVVFVISFLIDTRIVSRILQFIGIILCIAYWIFAIHSWCTNSKFSPPEPQSLRNARPPAAFLIFD